MSSTMRILGGLAVLGAALALAIVLASSASQAAVQGHAALAPDNSVDSSAIKDGSVRARDEAPLPAAQASGQITLSSGNAQDVQLTAESFDTAHMHSPNSTDLQAPQDGIYLVSASASWPPDATGTRLLLLNCPNSCGGSIFDTRPSLPSDALRLSFSQPVRLSANDAVSLDAGNQGATTQTASVTLSLTWIGPTG
jgi:hypothetical protein